MNLLTPEFLCFFLLVLGLHWALPRRLRTAWLVFASYFFYAWWDWRCAALLFALTAASYKLAGALGAARTPGRRRALIAAALVLHAGVLIGFKLAALGADSVDVLRGRVLAETALPLGLSYYTFQCLGYVLDVSRGVPAARSFLPYCLFAGFFAQLTAGPIGRARVLLPQMEAPRDFDRDRFFEGCHLIAWGVFQKVFVAENLAPAVVTVFDLSAADSGLSALVGVYAFTLQLYGDFAGYSNIARGLGKCLGYDLAENFRLPFFAQDMQEHWKRWHVSLSEWFADFVYRPFVDLPLGYWKFFAAPLFTLLLMGLWHKFSLQMAVLGLNYGFWIALTIFIKLTALRRGWEPRGALAAALPWINRFVTLHLVCAGFVLLRAHSLGQAAALAGQVFSPPRPTPQAVDLAKRLLFFASPLMLAEVVEFRRGGAGSLYRLPAIPRGVLYAGLAILLLKYGRFNSGIFFYSKF